ncbi:hypothetical protein ACP70R_018254 [Stipagrostis hirtigluma subsp. patula]
MASQQPRPPEAPTTIRALTDDLLREIFLRLPSLPSLVRAALACRAFLAAVRSSPAFRRRFRALHPPPLLGVFFDPDGDEMPSFKPVLRRSDPGLAAAVRGADVCLTRLPDSEDASPGWRLEECRGGRLLLRSRKTGQIAAYNPLTRAMHLFPSPPDKKVRHDCRGKFIHMDLFLLSSDEAPGSFRVVFVCHDKSRLRAAVFSSGTKKWQVLPWSQAAPEQPAPIKYWLRIGTQVNGSMYWSHDKHAYKVALDTATMQFSFIDLPEDLKGQGHLYQTGETKDGKLCIVAAVEFTLLIWLRRADANGAERWILDSVVPLEAEVLEATEGSRDDHEKLKVYAILDGTVYMSTFEKFRDDARLPCWFLSFCLDTRRLEKLFHTKSDGHVYPYIMAWPSSLVGNNVSP